MAVKASRSCLLMTGGASGAVTPSRENQQEIFDSHDAIKLDIGGAARAWSPVCYQHQEVIDIHGVI